MTNLDKARELVDELRLIGCHANGDSRCTCGIGQDAADLITALAEENRRLREALSLTKRADDLREVYHRLPNERNRIGDKRSRKSHARDAWLRAFRKAAKAARAALSSGEGE